MTKSKFPTELYSEKDRLMAEALVEIEEHALKSANLDEEEDCDCKEGMFNNVTRRGMLAASAALPLAFMSNAKAQGEEPKAPPGSVEYDVLDDPTSRQGRAILSDGGYGTRS